MTVDTSTVYCDIMAKHKAVSKSASEPKTQKSRARFGTKNTLGIILLLMIIYPSG
jgi:hypothetical protein